MEVLRNVLVVGIGEYLVLSSGSVVGPSGTESLGGVGGCGCSLLLLLLYSALLGN